MLPLLGVHGAVLAFVVLADGAAELVALPLAVEVGEVIALNTLVLMTVDWEDVGAAPLTVLVIAADVVRLGE